MFKSTTEQQDRYGLFAAPTVYSGSITGGAASFLYSQSPTLNSTSIKQMDSYFNEKIEVYSRYHLVTSGQVYPVYPEDWVAGGITVGRLTVKGLSGFLKSGGRVGIGSPAGLIGKDFEGWLQKTYGGQGSFKVRNREFDGAFTPTRWYEAKSGDYWNMLLSNPDKFKKFKSDMGDRQRIARDNGATYELHSNTPIPQKVKD